MKGNKYKYLPELIFACIGICISILLNMQFMEASNINTVIAGHDEYIAVKEVYSILHPVSLKHFIMAVISGNALYYGRIMFYLDALFAWIPFKIWGVTGMIMAVRMTHALVLLFALMLLGNTFLKNTLQRILFYTGSFGLYYTLYFIMMPKPEPWQLLFLALFFRGFYRSNFTFGTSFIWLGISYGLKFNVLLILPLVFALPLFKTGKLQLRTEWKGLLYSVMYFVAGLIIAIPCLILSPLKPIFLKTYLHETFGGTVKGYDDASLGIQSWMETGLGGNYMGLPFLAYIFIGLLLWILIGRLKKDFKERDFAALLFLLSGFVLILVIMLKTKRLWPHYLWTGYILSLLGMLMALWKEEGSMGKLRTSFLYLCLLSSFSYFVFRELPAYMSFSKSQYVINTTKWSKQCMEYIAKTYAGSRIGCDGTVMYPFRDFIETDIYHPFAGERPKEAFTSYNWYVDFPEKIWEQPNKVVVFYMRHPPRMLKEHPNVYTGRHEELYAIYSKMCEMDFVRDTSFGEIVLYRRK